MHASKVRSVMTITARVTDSRCILPRLTRNGFATPDISSSGVAFFGNVRARADRAAAAVTVGRCLQEAFPPVRSDAFAELLRRLDAIAW